MLGVEQVSVDAHFFDELGADSMVMARFCARVRKRDDLPSVSIKDVYAHPTVSELAAAFAPAAPAPVAAAMPDVPAAAVAAVPVLAAEAEPPVGTPLYVLCGALQLLIFLVYTTLTSLVVVRGFEWVIEAGTVVDVYLRSVAFTTGTFVALCALPIVAKWVLVGRWRPRQFRVWSMAYLRFWVAKTLIQVEPAGRVRRVADLRALPAGAGREDRSRRRDLLAGTVPACPDLLTIGDGTVDPQGRRCLSCYRAHDGVIQTGAVTLGATCSSARRRSSTSRRRWATERSSATRRRCTAGRRCRPASTGTVRPPSATDVDYRTVAAAPRSVLRRVAFAAVQLVSLLAVPCR